MEISRAGRSGLAYKGARDHAQTGKRWTTATTIRSERRHLCRFDILAPTIEV